MSELLSAGPISAAYEFREEQGAWTVVDLRTGRPAVLNGAPQTGLSLDEADDLAGVLNRAQRLVRSVEYDRED
jgi:hypothetical protein